MPTIAMPILPWLLKKNVWFFFHIILKYFLNILMLNIR